MGRGGAALAFRVATSSAADRVAGLNESFRGLSEMTSRVQRAALAALLLACATPAAAQTTPIFRMNCGATGANYPQCGWQELVGESSRGRYWNRSWVNGAGPNGEGVVQFDHIATSQVVEYYCGWAQNGLPQVPQGATRYIRYKIKFRNPTNLPAAQPDKAGWGGKFIILGDGADWSPDPEHTRFISNIQHMGDRVNWLTRSEMNIAGPPSRMDYGPIAKDVWHSVQIKIRSSTTRSSGNGRLFWYLDGANANENTPTVQSSGDYQINTDGWHATLGFGYYFLTLGPGGVASYQVTGFEYDDQFDPNWHTGGGGGGPTAPGAPSNVRIVGASASILGWGCIAALVTSIRLRTRRSAAVRVDQAH
jgi:hypothetical protein